MINNKNKKRIILRYYIEKLSNIIINQGMNYDFKKYYKLSRKLIRR